MVGFACIGSANTRILSDLESHLDSAKRCLDLGLFQQCRAHSQLVLIEEIRVHADGTREQQRVVEEAARLWEKAMDQTVDFTFVQDKSSADVTISFTKSLFRQGVEAGGYAKWKRSVYGDGLSQSRTTAQIELRTHAPNGKPMSFEEMRHCAAHELGHVLGLSDTTSIGEVMAPLQLGRPARAPGKEEVAALTAIREEAYKLQMLTLNLGWWPHGYNLLSEAA